MRYAYYFLFAAVALSLTGCVSARRYPANWPRPVTETGAACLSVTGTYHAVSVPWQKSDPACTTSKPVNYGFSGDPSCVSLPFILNAEPAYNVPAAATITIAQRPDGILVGGYAHAILIKDRDYHCAGNHIELVPPHSNESWNIGGGIDSKHWTLYRAEDGSLLAEYTEKAAGFILVPPIPVAVYANRWVRWEPVTGADESPNSTEGSESTNGDVILHQGH